LKDPESYCDNNTIHWHKPSVSKQEYKITKIQKNNRILTHHNKIYNRDMAMFDRGFEERRLEGETQSSDLALEFNNLPVISLNNLPVISQSFASHESPQAHRPTRLLSALYPCPGKIPGSRKRRANASNGPNSLSQATPEKSPSLSVQVTPILERNDSLLTGFESPMSTDFALTSPTRRSSHSSHYDSTPLVRNLMVDVPMTPKGLPMKSGAFSMVASPATPDIHIFNNLSIRSPILSNSPGSSFFQYPNRLENVTPSSCKVSSPVFHSSPSPRQVPVKVISNCATPLVNSGVRSLSKEQSPGISIGLSRIQSSPRSFRSKFTPPKLSLRMGALESRSLNPPQELKPPTLIFSSRVSPNDSYSRHTDDREIICQKAKDPWPILDECQLENEYTRPSLTPPLLPRRMSSNNYLKKNSAISSLLCKSTTNQSILKKCPSFPPHDARVNKDVDIEKEMNVLFQAYSNPGGYPSEMARNNVPRNINVVRKPRMTNPLKRHDSMTFSDDDSCTGKIMNESNGSHKPPTKILSLGQSTGKNKSSLNCCGFNRSGGPPKSLLTPGLHLPDEALEDMLHDAAGTDGNDTIGSLSDDETENSFFLTSPKISLRQPLKKTLRGLNFPLPFQDDNMMPPKRIENMKKKTRICPDEDNDWALSTKVEMSQYWNELHNENTISLSGFTSDNHREAPKNEKLRRHSPFSNMDVIRENSVSNASLVGMVYLPNETTSRSSINIRQCSESSKSSSGDDSFTFDHTASLRRNQSDQSLCSIGLSLEGVPLYSDVNCKDRMDMVTPPVIHYDSLTPPPIKKTRLEATFRDKR